MLLPILTGILTVYVVFANYFALQPVRRSYQSFIQVVLFIIYSIATMVVISYGFRDVTDEIVSMSFMGMLIIGVPAMLIGAYIGALTVAISLRKKLPEEIEMLSDGNFKYNEMVFRDKMDALRHYEIAKRKKRQPNKKR